MGTRVFNVFISQVKLQLGTVPKMSENWLPYTVYGEQNVPII